MKIRSLKNPQYLLIYFFLFAVFLKISILWIGFESRNSSWFGHLVVDVWGWLDFYKRTDLGQIPYVDFSKEYPTGAGILYWLIGHVIPNGKHHEAVLATHAIIMSLFDIVGATGLLVILQKFYLGEHHIKKAYGLSLLYLLSPTVLVLSPVRFEAFVILWVLLGIYFHKANRPLWATAAWSIGCSLKWFPIIFIGVQELNSIANSWEGPKKFLKSLHRQQWVYSAMIFIGVFGLFNLPFIFLGLERQGNFDNWSATYLFHVQRALYNDTVLGVLQFWVGGMTWERYASLWSIVLMALVFFYKPQMVFEKKCILIIIAAFLVNRVYSTQFHMWFLPLLILLIASDSRPGLIFICILLDLVNVASYPFGMAWALGEIADFSAPGAVTLARMGTTFFSICVVLRFILLALLFLWINRESESEFRKQQ